MPPAPDCLPSSEYKEEYDLSLMRKAGHFIKRVGGQKMVVACAITQFTMRGYHPGGHLRVNIHCLVMIYSGLANSEAPTHAADPQDKILPHRNGGCGATLGPF